MAVKRLLVVLAGGFGLSALLRRRRRRTVVPLAPVVPEQDSLAEELRAKLAESRAAEAEAAAEPATEPAPQDDLTARRREIHERARGSIDELGDV
jgi:hypothetical protein